MRKRLYIVSLIVVVIQTMTVLYVPIFAKDSTINTPSPQDFISQQLDTLLPTADSLLPKTAPIKKESIKSSQKPIKQEVKTEKAVDICLELSIKNDSTNLLAQVADSSNTCKDSQDSIFAKQDAGSCDTINNNGLEYIYKGKTVPHVLSEWAFPLIIMLFAFGFPFIFNGITRLEDKFHSEELSVIITTSKTYRFYKYILVIAVSFSAIYCIGLLTPILETTWVQGAGYILKIIGTVLIVISAILFIVSTILLVRDLFLYNDATKLFEKWKDKWSIDDKDQTTTKIIFSLYDYALRQEKKELLNAVEKKLLSLVENYRNDKAPKNNKRYSLDYPEPLLWYIYSLYENTLKTSNPQYQNRVIRLYCEVVFDRTNTLDDLPRIILSDAVLVHFWKMSKVTTLYKSESAFAILWTNLADYYCFLVNHDNTIKEQENILDLCFVIGAFNYTQKAGANLEFALSYTVGYYKNEKMSFTFIDNVLYRYYHCSTDYMFAKSTGIEAYEKYRIFDYEKATKKQQIAPLTQYVVFLLLRIYNQSPDFMQFDPIALRKKLFNQYNYRLTLSVVEMIQNKTLTSMEKSVFLIRKTMSKDDIDSFSRNLMTSSIRNEHVRLLETPVSEYCRQQFEDRLKKELHVSCFDMQKLLTPPKRQVQYGFSTSGSIPISYTDDTQKSIDFSDFGQKDLVIEPIWQDSIMVMKPKATFVYASFLQSSENIFATAKIISESIYKKHVNKIGYTLLLMKKGNASWATNQEDLTKKLGSCIQDKNLIIYISSKNEPNVYAPISLLKKDKAYLYDHGQSTYNNLPIIVLNGNELDQELYDKIGSSFIALHRDELPIISPPKNINDLGSYTLSYDDYKGMEEAMLKISISLETTLIYQKNVCKFIRYKNSK